MFHWAQTSLPVPVEFKAFGPHERFLTHQCFITENKQSTDKTYDESEMTRQKQHFRKHENPYGVSQHQ